MKTKKKKFAFTVGCFDMLHQGHIDLFKQMKKAGAESIFVLLHDDKSIFENKGKFPVQTFETRRKNLYDCGYVDAVYSVIEADPTNQIRLVITVYKGSGLNNEYELFYMRGDDWQKFPGKKILDFEKIPIKIKKYYKGVSSSKIRDSISKR